MAELLIKNSSVGCVRAVIFDKDGTLSNSEDYLIELAITRIEFFKNKLKKLKINKFKIWFFCRLLASTYGLKNNCLLADESLAIASREHNIVSTATILNLFNFNWVQSLLISQQIFDEVDMFLKDKKYNIQGKKRIITGAEDLLISLKGDGVCIALMTNDTESGIQEFISKNKLEGIFDYIWSSENKPSKPNPKAVIELCKRMKLNPTECALISDADTDLKMAKEADIPIVIGFTGGWRIPPTLNEKQFIIEKLNELNTQRNT